jgi:5-methylthioadenosine/S-adenosylhomocysteine deaminase
MPMSTTATPPPTADATAVDLLVTARWLIPIEPAATVLENHAIAVRDGIIVDIAPAASAKARYRAARVVDLPGHVLMPGLINAHGHAAMTLFRGLADDYPLMTWLQDYIWPAEGQYVCEEFVRDGVELAIAEMLRSGTTCFSDMYFFPGAAAEAAHRNGMRAQITFPVFDMPSAWGTNADDYLHKGLAVRDAFKHSRYVTIGIGPHAPYTVGDESMQKALTYAEELDMPMQIHLHETAFEVDDAVAKTGVRPLHRLHALGLLSPRLQCVHMTAIDDSDIAILQKTGAHVVHCPESNLKLASGFCPVHRLQQAGINVALGTDGAASNNDLDLFAELRTAALLAKAVAGDATAMPAHAALRMATLNGAIAMGADDRIGSLRAGKQADFIAIDLDTLETAPLYDVASQLAYTNASRNVTHAWVAGECLMQDRELTQLNAAELKARAVAWQQKLAHLRNR